MSNLRIPGPTPVPDDILAEMSRPMINHRGPEYRDLLERITAGLKEVFQTQNDVLVLTTSGTGGMEAAIVNTLSPGEEILSISIGSFGERFAQIAETYGTKVTKLEFPWGSAADPDQIREALKQNPMITAVAVTHNETSTGVTNDLQTIAGIVKGEFDKLLLVDGVSSISSLPCPTDEWGLDVTVSASQKGWMVPPALAFVAVSPRAWEATKKAKIPRFYFDFGRARSYMTRGENPWTPAVSAIYAMDLALRKLLSEGLEAIYSRHARLGQLTRDSVKQLGLSLFADERHASNTVTSVNVPEGVDGRKLQEILRLDHDVVVGEGQQHLAGKIVRIGHMGYVSEGDLLATFEAMAAALAKIRNASPTGARGG